MPSSEQPIYTQLPQQQSMQSFYNQSPHRSIYQPPLQQQFYYQPPPQQPFYYQPPPQQPFYYQPPPQQSFFNRRPSQQRIALNILSQNDSYAGAQNAQLSYQHFNQHKQQQLDPQNTAVTENEPPSAVKTTKLLLSSAGANGKQENNNNNGMIYIFI